MPNPYKQVKQISRKHSMTSDELLHALLATVYTTCCERCLDNLHSPQFVEALEHMMTELEFCKSLTMRHNEHTGRACYTQMNTDGLR